MMLLVAALKADMPGSPRRRGFLADKAQDQFRQRQNVAETK